MPKLLLVLPSLLVVLVAIALAVVRIPFEPEPYDYQFEPKTLQQKEHYERNVAPHVSSLPFENTEFLLQGQTLAPEDLAVSPNGKQAYAGLLDGRIVVVETTSNRNLTLKEFARTGIKCSAEVDLANCGRPLGLIFVKADAFQRYLPSNAPLFSDNHVLLCTDAYKGLLLFDASGNFIVLTNEAAGTRLKVLNGAAVVQSGEVYMTQSTEDFEVYDVMQGALQVKRSGRLIRFDPTTNSTTVVATGLGFPNGIISSDHGKKLLIAMSFQSKIIQVDVTTTPPQIHDFAYLPGLPDNIWLGNLGSTTKQVLFVGLTDLPTWWNMLLTRPTALRKLEMMFLPIRMVAGWITGTAFLTVDPFSGNVLQAFKDHDGKAGVLSGVHAFKDDYYLMTWQRASFARFPTSVLA